MIDSPSRRFVLFLPLCTLLFLLGAAPSLSAQAVLEIGSQGVLNYPTVIDSSEDVTLNFYVKNTGNVVFNDTILTRHAVNGGSASTVDTTEATLINPGDSALISVDDYEFSTPGFNLGRNGVVIWVTDDNLSPAQTNDYNEVFLTDGPAFRIGNFGITGFPSQADTASTYSFDIHVENATLDDYEDTLYVQAEVNGQVLTWPSTDRVAIPGTSSVFQTATPVHFRLPPYLLGNNQVKLWVRGTGNTVAIDTAFRTVTVSAMTFANPREKGFLKIGPNPVRRNEFLQIEASSPVTRLQIISKEGKTLADFQPGKPIVSWQLPPHKKGVLFLIIHLRNQETIYRRLLVW